LVLLKFLITFLLLAALCCGCCSFFDGDGSKQFQLAVLGVGVPAKLARETGRKINGRCQLAVKRKVAAKWLLLCLAEHL